MARPARLHRDLGDLRTARKQIKKSKRPEAALLRAVLGREARDPSSYAGDMDLAGTDPSLEAERDRSLLGRQLADSLPSPDLVLFSNDMKGPWKLP